MSGDEVLGLTRGFLYAGTPSVLASLWPVRNEPTLQLMDRFYARLLGTSLDKADSPPGHGGRSVLSVVWN
jgi:CHAT domain-containing protein